MSLFLNLQHAPAYSKGKNIHMVLQYTILQMDLAAAWQLSVKNKE